jgi:hypothetical protein
MVCLGMFVARVFFSVVLSPRQIVGLDFLLLHSYSESVDGSRIVYCRHLEVLLL